MKTATSAMLHQDRRCHQCLLVLANDTKIGNRLVAQCSMCIRSEPDLNMVAQKAVYIESIAWSIYLRSNSQNVSIIRKYATDRKGRCRRRAVLAYISSVIYFGAPSIVPGSRAAAFPQEQVPLAGGGPKYGVLHRGPCSTYWRSVVVSCHHEIAE